MRHSSRRIAGAAWCLLAIGSSSLARAQSADFAVDRYLRDSVGFDAGQMADVQRGRAVAKVLPTQSTRDVTAVGVVIVHTTRDAYIARLGDIQRLLAPQSQRFGIIGDPVTAADLSGIATDESEYRDLRDCKANNCNFKIPVSTMEQFARNVDWKRPDAKTQVDSLVRVDLRTLINNYRATGDSAMVRYDDSGGTRSSDAFVSLLDESPYLRTYAAGLRDYLTAYPALRPADARDILYWSEDKISPLRPTFTLSHLVVYTPASGAPLVAKKQIYASHYFDAAFELLAAFEAPPVSGTPVTYLVCVRRYRFDNLPGGVLNIRGRVQGELTNLLRSDLENERKLIESR